TAYYKDIENLIATRDVAIGGGGTIVTSFANVDFSNVQGLDLKLTKRRSRYFFGSINYSLMFARGLAPEETYAYYNIIGVAAEDFPQKQYPLDFDQRHTLTLNMDLRTPRDWQGKFLGVAPLSGSWGMNVIGRYGSGMPYTKYSQKTGERVGGRNEYRMPFTFTIDARINRDFYFGESSRYLSVFVEVENLFNRRNVVNVYNTTGLWDDDGVEYTDGGALVTEQRASELYDLITNDPQHLGPPRTIRTGLQFNF
ncbi:MAG TPA: hypothetical protein VLB27_08045, partial [candidate division Zixibacteria bacterium]|nr:hypothetical protein [candidate division Zixibacteria bacterium]